MHLGTIYNGPKGYLKTILITEQVSVDEIVEMRQVR